MRACTIISKLFILFALLSSPTYAQSEIPPTPPTGVPLKKDSPGLFDQSSPYLNYGDFNMNEEENEDTQYFQYGRYFGLSFGAGYQTATGNRGKLYTAALPRFDLRMQYWFNFNLAADLGVFFANHSFESNSTQTEVKMIGYGFHLKYYFDTKDASAAISFANPHLIGGIGALSKSETKSTSSVANSDSTLSVSMGGGLEFPVVHKKTYLSLEWLYHTQNFEDNRSTDYNDVVPDVTGGFMTLLAHFMFVW